MQTKQIPFQDAKMFSNELEKEIVHRNLRPAVEESEWNPIYLNITKSCWNATPNLRPSAQHLIQLLSKLNMAQKGVVSGSGELMEASKPPSYDSLVPMPSETISLRNRRGSMRGTLKSISSKNLSKALNFTKTSSLKSLGSTRQPVIKSLLEMDVSSTRILSRSNSHLLEEDSNIMWLTENELGDDDEVKESDESKSLEKIDEENEDDDI